MPNKILVATNGTPLVFAHAADFSEELGSITHEIDITNLASAAARQSAKADWVNDGVTNRYRREFAITVIIEWGVGGPPTPGTTVDFYWASSVSATAATANPGGVNGSDGLYTGTAGSTLDESLRDLQLLGKLHVTNDADVQRTTFKAILPTQFGSLVVRNGTAEPLDANGADMAVFFTPNDMELP